MFRAVYTSCAFLCLFLLAWTPALSGDDSYQADSCGSIRGRVIDAVSGSPVAGARLEVEGSGLGTFADSFGRFMMAKVPAGNHVLTVRSVGFERGTISAVVFAGTTAAVTVALQPQPIKLGTTTVRGTHAAPVPIAPGALEFSSEELKHSAGPAGDINRIVGIHPGVAKVSDLQNSLIVRGGTPSENGFYVDGIEVPNTDHFPINGAAGGSISLLNLGYVENAVFFAGGFSAAYGDRPSSVTDVTFREGNRERFAFHCDLNLGGTGAGAEGPVARGRGAWLFSIRRSYVDLVADMIGEKYAPRYDDCQGKFVYDISPQHRISVLGLAGWDFIEFPKEQAVEDGSHDYGTWKGREHAVGMSWRYSWGTTGYSCTSVSTIATRYRRAWSDTQDDLLLSYEDTDERAIQFRNVNGYGNGRATFLEFGVEAKRINTRLNISNVRLIDHLGGSVPAGELIDDINAGKSAAFIGCTQRLVLGLRATVGLRYDYFDYSDHGYLSPRFSFSLPVVDSFTITGAAGVYRQFLPLALLAQFEHNRKLQDIAAYHYLLSVNWLITEHTRLSVEGYVKNSRHYPLDSKQPGIFIADEFIHRENFGFYEFLTDAGRASSIGIELTLHKRQAQGIHGLISGSYSRSRYQGLDGVWRDRAIDNRLIFGVEGGWRPNDAWDISLRWIFAGGPPYTPLDLTASRRWNALVFDKGRINGVRYPDYHALNLRVERRFHVAGARLAVYASVWNVYDRDNVFLYTWNQVERRQTAIYQWGIMPLAGVKVDF